MALGQAQHTLWGNILTEIIKFMFDLFDSKPSLFQLTSRHAASEHDFKDHHSRASQRSLHNAPIFRLLLKVAVNGTHQCDFLNFCGGLGRQRGIPLTISCHTKLSVATPPKTETATIRCHTPRHRHQTISCHTPKHRIPPPLLIVSSHTPRYTQVMSDVKPKL